MNSSLKHVLILSLMWKQMYKIEIIIYMCVSVYVNKIKLACIPYICLFRDLRSCDTSAAIKIFSNHIFISQNNFTSGNKVFINND